MAETIRSRVLYWIPLLLWISLIYGLSSQTSVPFIDRIPVDTLREYGHIVGHFTEYAVLAVTAYIALGSSALFRESRMLRLTAAFVMVVFVAAGDEFLQAFIPGRDASKKDLAVDIFGTTTGLVMVTLGHGLLDRLWPWRSRDKA